MSGKRYKQKKKKNFMNFFLFYTLMFVLIFVSYSFSRYSTVVTSNATLSIAKFNVKVNGKSVTENEKFELNLNSENQATTDNKLAPGSNGYFEIEIDPTGTEVSLEYQIYIKFDGFSNFRGFQVQGYTINDGSITDIDSNTITGEINLPSTDKGFTEEDITYIKIYYDWKDSDDIDMSDLTIQQEQGSLTVDAIIRQKV